jgi:type IV pilus assembly protein PilO
MLSRLTGQMIAFIVIGVTVLIALLWYFLMYQNTLAEQETLRTEIQGLTDQVEIGKKAQANVQQLCGVIVELQAQKREFLKALPSSEKFADLLRILKTQVGNNNGRINSLTRAAGAGSQALPAGVRAVSTGISVEGSYQAITGILQSFEGQQRFLRIDNMNIGIGGQNSSTQATEPVLSTQIPVVAYIYDGARGTENQAADPICAQFLPQPTDPATPTSEVPR